LPLHVWHEHEAEVHEHALLAHDEEHSCTFDIHFCEHHDAGDCGHTAHLEQTHAGCFSCTFHFTDFFTLTAWLWSGVTASVHEAYTVYEPSYAHTFIADSRSRGPPVVWVATSV